MTLRGDAQRLPVRDGVAQCVITSPPYLGQRVYGTDPRELGREGTVLDFVRGIVSAAEEVRRVLCEHGVFFLSLADKANGSGGAGGDYNQGGSKQGRPRYGRFRDPRYEPGQFLNVPGWTVGALLRHGWRLRQTIVWDKGTESRESLDHVNRPRTSHEFIFMLQPGPGRSKYRPQSWGTGSIWTMKPARGNGHLAPFPEELPTRCIQIATDPGDLVIDPFVGSGTTLRAAELLGRRALGVDLYGTQ
jgi:DNA modification methylase